jgi:SNF family Na+-dependent transporter
VFIIGWILYYVWNFLTKQVKPKLIAVLELLNSLAESVKTARNDIDKLNQKISIITVLKEQDQREDKP